MLPFLCCQKKSFTPPLLEVRVYIHQISHDVVVFVVVFFVVVFFTDNLSPIPCRLSMNRYLVLQRKFMNYCSKLVMKEFVRQLKSTDGNAN